MFYIRLIIFVQVLIHTVIFVQVELLIPQLQFLDEEGAQGELWELSRIFIETLREETTFQVRRKDHSFLRCFLFTMKDLFFLLDMNINIPLQ